MKKNTEQKSQPKTEPPITPAILALEEKKKQIIEQEVKRRLANPTLIENFDDLQKIIEDRVHVDFEWQGKPYRIDVRRLTPREEAALADIIDSVRCKIIQGNTPESDRLDWSDPEFIKAKHRAEIEARAYGLYWCCPLFAKKKPGLIGKDILEFIQNSFNEPILKEIWDAIRNPVVEVAALTNFTSPESSVKS